MERQQNPGLPPPASFPDFVSLHPGYSSLGAAARRIGQRVASRLAAWSDPTAAPHPGAKIPSTAALASPKTSG